MKEKRTRPTSVNSDVVTKDGSVTPATGSQIREQEMNVVALTKLLDSKQRTLASLVQQNATETSIALAVTQNTYSETNILWKRVLESTNQIDEQRRDITGIEKALLQHAEKRPRIELEGVTISYATPAASAKADSSQSDKKHRTGSVSICKCQGSMPLRKYSTVALFSCRVFS